MADKRPFTLADVFATVADARSTPAFATGSDPARTSNEETTSCA
jgi:hypothetical protein